MLSAAEQLELHALKNSRSSLVTFKFNSFRKTVIFTGQERDVSFFCTLTSKHILMFTEFFHQLRDYKNKFFLNKNHDSNVHRKCQCIRLLDICIR